MKKELDLDRDHNKKVVEQVFKGLCKRIDILEKYAVQQSSDHSKQLSDLDLKVETVTSYQEQLINSLADKVQRLHGELKSHKNSCHGVDLTSVCGVCDLIFKSTSINTNCTTM